MCIPTLQGAAGNSGCVVWRRAFKNVENAYGIFFYIYLRGHSFWRRECTLLYGQHAHSLTSFLFFILIKGFLNWFYHLQINFCIATTLSTWCCLVWQLLGAWLMYGQILTFPMQWIDNLTPHSHDMKREDYLRYVWKRGTIKDVKDASNT